MYIREILEKFSTVENMEKQAFSTFDLYWEKQIQARYNEIPYEILEKIKESARSVIKVAFKDTDSIYEIFEPVYEKYYTESDLHALAEFYRTPLGEKVISVSSLITTECANAGQDWMNAVLFPSLDNALKDTFQSIENAKQK